MGSGKTTIGKEVANRLNINFLDLDAYIEQAEGVEIKTLFATKGELYFRKKETFYLNEILNSENSFLLSTGGGTPCYANNMEAITKATPHNVYLKVTLQELVARLVNEKEHRPLISAIADEDLQEFIGKHLFERSYYYNQATITLASNGRTATEIATALLKRLV